MSDLSNYGSAENSMLHVEDLIPDNEDARENIPGRNGNFQQNNFHNQEGRPRPHDQRVQPAPVMEQPNNQQGNRVVGEEIRNNQVQPVQPQGPEIRFAMNNRAHNPGYRSPPAPWEDDSGIAEIGYPEPSRVDMRRLRVRMMQQRQRRQLLEQGVFEPEQPFRPLYELQFEENMEHIPYDPERFNLYPEQLPQQNPAQFRPRHPDQQGYQPHIPYMQYLLNAQNLPHQQYHPFDNYSPIIQNYPLLRHRSQQYYPVHHQPQHQPQHQPYPPYQPHQHQPQRPPYPPYRPHLLQPRPRQPRPRQPRPRQPRPRQPQQLQPQQLQPQQLQPQQLQPQQLQPQQLQPQQLQPQQLQPQQLQPQQLQPQQLQPQQHQPYQQQHQPYQQPYQQPQQQQHQPQQHQPQQHQPQQHQPQQHQPQQHQAENEQDARQFQRLSISPTPPSPDRTSNNENYFMTPPRNSRNTSHIREIENFNEGLFNAQSEDQPKTSTPNRVQPDYEQYAVPGPSNYYPDNFLPILRNDNASFEERWNYEQDSSQNLDFEHSDMFEQQIPYNLEIANYSPVQEPPLPPSIANASPYSRQEHQPPQPVDNFIRRNDANHDPWTGAHQPQIPDDIRPNYWRPYRQIDNFQQIPGDFAISNWNEPDPDQDPNQSNFQQPDDLHPRYWDPDQSSDPTSSSHSFSEGNTFNSFRESNFIDSDLISPITNESNSQGSSEYRNSTLEDSEIQRNRRENHYPAQEEQNPNSGSSRGNSSQIDMPRRVNTVQPYVYQNDIPQRHGRDRISFLNSPNRQPTTNERSINRQGFGFIPNPNRRPVNNNRQPIVNRTGFGFNPNPSGIQSDNVGPNNVNRRDPQNRQQNVPRRIQNINRDGFGFNPNVQNRRSTVVSVPTYIRRTDGRYGPPDDPRALDELPSFVQNKNSRKSENLSSKGNVNKNKKQMDDIQRPLPGPSGVNRPGPPLNQECQECPESPASRVVPAPRTPANIYSNTGPFEDDGPYDENVPKDVLNRSSVWRVATPANVVERPATPRDYETINNSGNRMGQNLNNRIIKNSSSDKRDSRRRRKAQRRGNNRPSDSGSDSSDSEYSEDEELNTSDTSDTTDYEDADDDFEDDSSSKGGNNPGGSNSRGNNSRGNDSRGNNSRSNNSRGNNSRGNNSRGNNSRGNNSRGNSSGGNNSTSNSDRNNNYEANNSQYRKNFGLQRIAEYNSIISTEPSLEGPIPTGLEDLDISSSQLKESFKFLIETPECLPYLKLEENNNFKIIGTGKKSDFFTFANGQDFIHDLEGEKLDDEIWQKLFITWGIVERMHGEKLSNKFEDKIFKNLRRFVYNTKVYNVITKSMQEMRYNTINTFLNLISFKIGPYCEQLILKTRTLWPESKEFFLKNFINLKSIYIQLEKKNDELIEFFNDLTITDAFNNSLEEYRISVLKEKDWAPKEISNHIRNERKIKSLQVWKSELSIVRTLYIMYDDLEKLRMYIEDYCLEHDHFCKTLYNKSKLKEFYVCWNSQLVTRDNIMKFVKDMKLIRKNVEKLTLEFEWNIFADEYHEDGYSQAIHDLSLIPKHMSNLKKLCINCKFNNFRVAITNNELTRRLVNNCDLKYLKIYLTDEGQMPMKLDLSNVHTLELYFRFTKHSKELFGVISEKKLILTLDEYNSNFREHKLVISVNQNDNKIKSKVKCLKLMHLPTFNEKILNEIAEEFPQVERLMIKAARGDLYVGTRNCENIYNFVKKFKFLQCLIFNDEFVKFADPTNLILNFFYRALQNTTKMYKLAIDGLYVTNMEVRSYINAASLRPNLRIY